MINMRDFALNMISRNPQVANNPQAQSYIDVIRGGDANKMKELATNICNSYGMTTDQAANGAMKFFGVQR